MNMKTRTLLQLGLIAVFLSLGGCVSPFPPEGTPIDFEAQREFKSFRMRTLEGDMVSLDDFLNRATLISFFFPT